MGLRFRSERPDRGNEDKPVALHVAVALDTTDRNDLDNRQLGLHQVAVRGAKPR